MSVFEDVVRWAVILAGTFDLGAILVVFVAHLKAYRRAPEQARLLPRHVLFVSLAQGFFIVGVVLAYLQNFTFSYRSAFYTLGVIFTAFAMIDVLRYQRRRLIETLRFKREIEKTIADSDVVATGELPHSEEDKK